MYINLIVDVPVCESLNKTTRVLCSFVKNIKTIINQACCIWLYVYSVTFSWRYCKASLKWTPFKTVAKAYWYSTGYTCVQCMQHMYIHYLDTAFWQKTLLKTFKHTTMIAMLLTVIHIHNGTCIISLKYNDVHVYMYIACVISLYHRSTLKITQNLWKIMM